MKALIVEDNEDIISFLRIGLKYEGFLVDVASDGEAALEKTRDCCYNLIILDLVIPKIDGKDCLKRLRNEGVQVPVIVLSAIHDQNTKAELLDYGADDYISKPFSMTELVARIKAILRRSKNTTSVEVIKVEDLVINPSTQEVFRQEKRINLRKKEFALLYYLAKNKGKVIKHTQILEAVWDFNSSLLSNTVGTHISSLRKKVDNKHERKLIQTIHGTGYKIS